MSDPGSQIETLRERIEESAKIAAADRDALLDFSDERYLPKTEYGDCRRLKLLRHFTRMAEHVVASLTRSMSRRCWGDGPLDQPHLRLRREQSRLPGITDHSTN